MITHSIIQTLLDTQLNTVTGLPTLQEENTRVRPALNAPWTRSTLLPAITEISTLGIGGYNRLNGLYKAEVFTAQDAGRADGAAYADLILEKFNAGQQLVSGTDVVLIRNSYILPHNFMGTFYVKSVIVEWEAYQLRGV